MKSSIYYYDIKVQPSENGGFFPCQFSDSRVDQLIVPDFSKNQYKIILNEIDINTDNLFYFIYPNRNGVQIPNKYSLKIYDGTGSSSTVYISFDTSLTGDSCYPLFDKYKYLYWVIKTIPQWLKMVNRAIDACLVQLGHSAGDLSLNYNPIQKLFYFQCVPLSPFATGLGSITMNKMLYKYFQGFPAKYIADEAEISFSNMFNEIDPSTNINMYAFYNCNDNWLGISSIKVYFNHGLSLINNYSLPVKFGSQSQSVATNNLLMNILYNPKSDPSNFYNIYFHSRNFPCGMKTLSPQNLKSCFQNMKFKVMIEMTDSDTEYDLYLSLDTNNMCSMEIVITEDSLY